MHHLFSLFYIFQVDIGGLQEAFFFSPFTFGAVSQFLTCRKGEIPVIHQVQSLQLDNVLIQASEALNEEKRLISLSLCIHLHNFWVQYGPLWDSIHLFCKETVLPGLAASLKVLASGRRSCSSQRMITVTTSGHAGTLTRLILDCQAYTSKCYNPYFYIDKDTSDSGLYNIACETKHTHCDGSVVGVL